MNPKAPGRPTGSTGNAIVKARQRQVIEELLQMGHTARDAASLASRKLNVNITERKVISVREEMYKAFDEIIESNRKDYLKLVLQSDLAYCSFLLREYEDSKKPLTEIALKGATLSPDLLAELEDMKVRIDHVRNSGDEPADERQNMQRVLFDVATQRYASCTITTREQKGNVTLLQEYRRVVESIRERLGINDMRFTSEEDAIAAVRVIFDLEKNG